MQINQNGWLKPHMINVHNVPKATLQFWIYVLAGRYLFTFFERFCIFYVYKEWHLFPISSTHHQQQNISILIYLYIYKHSKSPSQLAPACRGKHSDICLQNLCLMFWVGPCLCVVCLGNLMIMKSPNIHPTLKEVKWALSQSYRNVPSALRLFKVLICSGIKTSIKILE